MGVFSTDIGIDLGTANTLVYAKGKGVVLQEPSVVAVHHETGEVLAVGSAAKEMLGKAPGNITIIRPLRDGVIANFDVTKKMLRIFLRKVDKKYRVRKPRVIVSVPSGITTVEKYAVIDATLSAGAREAYLIEEPVAAAIGAGLPVYEPKGNMIMNIGSGTTEIAIVSLGGIVISKSIRVGGDEMDEAITRYLRREYSFMIGERTAEYIKKTIGSAHPALEPQNLPVRGRDLFTGLPKTLNISSQEIHLALAEPIREMVNAARSTLEQTPPDLVADVVEQGLTLTGGGALLKGLPDLLREELGIPVHVADEPLVSVVRGTGIALEQIGRLKKLLYTRHH